MQRLIVHRRLKRPIRAPKSRGSFLFLVAAVNVLLLLVLGGSTIVAGGAGTVYAYNLIKKDLPDPASLSVDTLPQVTQIYDRTGQHLLYEFYEEKRIEVPLSDITPVMQKATLAAEDANFYSHPGFDPMGILRAAIRDFQTGGTVQGASTITQQLVKRMLLSDEHTYSRKLREIVLATQVESLYSKDHILEMYLNQVYYGNQAYGVEAAAQSYFHTHAKDLDLAQASLIAGLVQLPSVYDPVLHPQAALDRQRYVLNEMVRHGWATQEDADAALEESQGFTYHMQETNISQPHFAFFARDELRKMVDPQTLNKGLKVISTLDVDLNNKAQEVIRKRVDEIRWQHVNNSSLVAIDPHTGEILAMVGSYDYNDKSIDGQVNVSTALRQPGSSFKIFTYATAFGTKRFAPSSLIADVPLSRIDVSSKTGLYQPLNYDFKWHGNVTIRTALSNSLNIPALLTQDAVGTKEVINTARKLGITTELPDVPSLTLGAGVVRLLDMTSAYGTFANGGVRIPPTPFLHVEDWSGNVIYDIGQPKGEQVIAPEVAYMISDVLSDKAARRMEFGNVLDLPGPWTAAVKTGTTNDYKDSWTLGYTPNIVTGVWVGNTDNSAMLQVAGSLGAGYIWKDFMAADLKDQPDQPFAMPPGVVRAPICRGYRQTDLFFKDAVPTSCPPILVPGPEWRATPYQATVFARNGYTWPRGYGVYVPPR